MALVTGVGRRIVIGAAVTGRLARDGFDVGFIYWGPYDERMPWGSDPETPVELARRVQGAGSSAQDDGGDAVGHRYNVSLT